jgi:hypothetical protein
MHMCVAVCSSVCMCRSASLCRACRPILKQGILLLQRTQVQGWQLQEQWARARIMLTAVNFKVLCMLAILRLEPQALEKCSFSILSDLPDELRLLFYRLHSSGKLFKQSSF